MNYKKELKIAVNAVNKACGLCADVQHKLVAADTLNKSDKSPVTIADFGSQAIINFVLGKEFPKDDYVCEEDSDQLRREESLVLRNKVHSNVRKIFSNISKEEMLKAIDLGSGNCDFKGRYWTLDPIDGTKGFLRGDQYAIALALVVKGEVVLGVLGCPNMDYSKSDKGVIYYGVKGFGAYALSIKTGEVRRITVDRISSADKAVFCESVESAHTAHSQSAEIGKLLKVSSEPYRIDSQCKYAAVASGMASVYLRLPTRPGYQEKIWDHAAGKIIVEESGGKVTDITGKALDFSQSYQLTENSGVVATNGILHDIFVEAIGETDQTDQTDQTGQTD